MPWNKWKKKKKKKRETEKVQRAEADEAIVDLIAQARAEEEQAKGTRRCGKSDEG